jgi:hypothetical protein
MKALRPVLNLFRFDKQRDLTFGAPKVQTCYVLAYGQILGDVGIYGAPVAVLHGYEVVQPTNQSRRDASLASIKASPRGSAKFVTGRLIELTLEELARLDSLTEHSPEDYHRFQAEVILPGNGHSTLAWVFQRTADASLVDRGTSVNLALVEAMA